MKFEKLVRDEIKNLEPSVHGGKYWELMEKYKFSKEELIDFSANMNPLGPSPQIKEEIEEGFWKIPFYPDSDSSSLKEALSDHIGVHPEDVIVGNGSTELIRLLAETFIKKGDEIIIPMPTFGEYEFAVRLMGGFPIYVKLKEDENFLVQGDEIIQVFSPKTKAIFLCNPNNPTSKLIPKEELFKIIEEAETHNILVFIDEAFIEFADVSKFSFAKWIKKHPNTFVLRSMTKVYCLTGLRVGYGIGSEELINYMNRAKQFWNVNCFAQLTAIVALQDQKHLKKSLEFIEKEKEYLMNELTEILGEEISKPDANFFFLDTRSSGYSSPQLCAKLIERGILIRDCSSFKFLDENHVRVAIRKRKENRYFVDTFKEVLTS